MFGLETFPIRLQLRVYWIFGAFAIIFRREKLFLFTKVKTNKKNLCKTDKSLTSSFGNEGNTEKFRKKVKKMDQEFTIFNKSETC